MDSAAAGGGMQRDAGCRSGVVGGLGPVQRRNGAVRLPRSDDINAMRAQHRAQPHRQSQDQVFFQRTVRQARATIGAAMGGVDHHHKARRLPHSRRRR